MAGSPSALLDRFRAALTRARFHIQKLLLRVKELTAPPHIYAAVLAVKDVASAADSIPSNGTRVRVLTSTQFPGLVGKTGFVLSDEPDENGEVLVIFDDGARGFFGVGLTERKNTAKEIEPTTVGQRLAVVALDNRMVELPFPDGLDLQAGDTVLIAQKSSAIVDVVHDRDIGEIVVVRRVVNDRRCEITYHDQVRVVSTGRYGQKLEVGDRVVIDPSISVVLFSFGGTDDQYQVHRDTGVSWDDIGGLAEPKRLIRQAIVGRIKDAKLYEAYRRPSEKGALILGPPGVGKTMLVKAGYTELVALHGQQYSPTGFLYVKGPELLRSYVGAGEAEVRQLFAQARKHYARYHYPAIIFIDEADALLSKRGTGISSDVNNTIVPAFLAEMDGLDDASCYVILATNRPDILDPAATRDGRIDRKIEIGRPDRASTEAIFRIYLGRTMLAGGSSVDQLAAAVTTEMYDPKYALYAVQLRGSQEGQVKTFCLPDLSSGAMIRGIVNQAIDLAIDRDRSSGEATGLTAENLTAAVASVFLQNQRLNHADALQDFVREVPEDQLGRVIRLRQVIT